MLKNPVEFHGWCSAKQSATQTVPCVLDTSVHPAHTNRDLICTRISNLVKLKGKLLFSVTFCYGTFSLTCFATAKLSSADFFLFPFLPHYQSTLIRVLSSVWFRLSCYLHYYEYSVVFNVAANTNFGPRWVALF